MNVVIKISDKLEKLGLAQFAISEAVLPIINSVILQNKINSMNIYDEIYNFTGHAR